ncbi:MAG TPA: hypothetical protein VEB41_14245 [Burkholderiales bacterium]|nr:hypothetical protein [Burkholderiales bacterium]
MRILALIEYAAIVIGIAGMIAGRFFELHKGFELGLFLVGAGVALAGIEGIATQRMGLRAADDSYEVYAGTPALVVGILLLLAGAATIGAAYLIADGLWGSTIAYLKNRPGALLAASAVLLAGVGVLLMLNPRGSGGLLWTLVVYVPRAFAGVILVLAGLVALAVGAWEFLDPRAFDDFVAKLPAVRDVARKARELVRSL